MLQRPIVSYSGAQATVSVSDGGTVLIAGFSPLPTGATPAAKAATQPTAKADRVFLLVKARNVLDRHGQ